MIADPLPNAWRFDALGTPWRIDTEEPLPDEVRELVAARVERFDRDWSRYRDDSLVARIARHPGRHRLPADAAPLLGLYRELYAATRGRVSPLVGGALAAAGFGPRLGGVPDAVPRFEDALAWDGEHLDTASPVLLDVGAAGKGYLVDLVSGLLAEAGIARSVVDGSGDLRIRDVPMRIALEHPADATRAVGVAELVGGALSASAGNRRRHADGRHHVLDAVTGLPARDVVATWAVAADDLVADGAATALFFDVDRGWLERRGVEWVRMLSDGSLEASPGFPGEVFA
ncbi:FAD:protein FMN transferase [Protaetiibacter intestinalis]|uniref:FAD:protein FMN transferase n=1 Tax=Protaetiibacter intestinalis TaxID=2419774 RepID=A0A387B6U3_9MICO|nr:FAD:protein FMN transferase [Protaetiibacter intestinalis]AYF97468.1 FAD:protein FMN transferase [Protaetiibacter intestinalis]